MSNELAALNSSHTLKRSLSAPNGSVPSDLHQLGAIASSLIGDADLQIEHVSPSPPVEIKQENCGSARGRQGPSEPEASY